jgi:hypothetical protein
MKLKLLSELASFIETLFTHAAPVVAQAAEGAAVASAESDPRVQAVTEASVALLAAAQTLKTAIANHPDAPAS